MSKKRVLIDCDGVLMDFLTPALDVVHKVSGKRYEPHEFKTWDIFDTVPAQYKSECHTHFIAPGFAKDLRPFQAAQEALPLLAEMAEIYIVTSPYTASPTWVHERTLALKEHFAIPSNRVVHTSAKYLVEGDIFIDDNQEHVEKWAAHHPGGMPVLWDMPYNKRDPFIKGPWMRTSSWDDISFHLGRLG